MKYACLALIFTASAAHAATPVNYYFRALAEHGATNSSAPTLYPRGTVVKITVIVDADAVGTPLQGGGMSYQGGVACPSTNANPPVIAVYVNGNTAYNYGGGACTNIAVTPGGISMDSANLEIGEQFTASFTAVSLLRSYAIPKYILTTTQFTRSTYGLFQPNGMAVTGDWAGQ